MMSAVSANEGWVEVCAVDDIDEEDVMGFTHDGKHYAIYHMFGDNFYASDGVCTHEQVRLTDGFVYNGCIECPRHNAKFDVQTGKAKSPPATVDLTMYPVKLQGDKVFVQLETEGN